MAKVSVRGRRAKFGPFIVLLLQGSTAWAQATVQLVQPNNLTPMVNYADPVAISGNLLTDAQNTILKGDAIGAADLTTGTARVYSNGAVIISPGVEQVGLPQASAALSDSITLAGPGASALVTLQFAVDGFVSPASSTTSGTFDQTVVANCGIGVSPSVTSKQAGVTRVYSGPTSDVFATSVTPKNDPNVVVTWNGSGFTMSIAIAVTVPVGRAVGVGCGLFAQGDLPLPEESFAVIEDLGNTGRMSITLPAGYTFTSASGVLLSNAGGPGLSLDGGNAPSTSSDGGATNDGGTSSGGTSSGGTTGTGGPGATHGSSSGGCSAGGQGSAAAVALGMLGIWILRRSQKRCLRA